METRSWATRYRGPLAIHAALGLPRAARRLCDTAPFAEALRRHGYRCVADLPRGAVIATCSLVDVRRVVSAADVPDGDEAAFGDFRPGRCIWVLKCVRPLPRPLPARGRLGLWEVVLPQR